MRKKERWTLRKIPKTKDRLFAYRGYAIRKKDRKYYILEPIVFEPLVEVDDLGTAMTIIDNWR